MCSVCSPPSLPNPNWGALTSWPELNWVVVPVASVSFPVSQGGLHSHCVRHFIVQAGCNQADESRISRNTLRAFFLMSEKCCEIPIHTNRDAPNLWQSSHKGTRHVRHSHTHTHTSPRARAHFLKQREFIWWIWKSPTFCDSALFLSVKPLVFAVMVCHGLCACKLVGGRGGVFFWGGFSCVCFFVFVSVFVFF